MNTTQLEFLRAYPTPAPDRVARAKGPLRKATAESKRHWQAQVTPASPYEMRPGAGPTFSLPVLERLAASFAFVRPDKVVRWQHDRFRRFWAGCRNPSVSWL